MNPVKTVGDFEKTRVTFWPDRAILHRVSTSMVQSKLDYGFHIYGSASDSLLHELESVRNKALRLEIGALYTSNADSLHTEANVIPLHFHREFVATKSLLRIHLSPASPLMSFYYQALIPDDSWPFSRMVSEAFYTIGEMQPEVIPFNFITSPPWICPQPKICFSLGSRTKRS